MSFQIPKWGWFSGSGGRERGVIWRQDPTHVSSGSFLINTLGALKDTRAIPYAESTQIYQWLRFTAILSSSSTFDSACESLDDYLQGRTLLVAHYFSVANMAIWSSLAGTGLRWKRLRKSNKYQNLARWFNSILAEYNDALTTVVQNLASRDAYKARGKSSSEVDLSDAEVGKVICAGAQRLPSHWALESSPVEPVFSSEIPRRSCFAFDDTNPAEESSKFVENLIKDVETLGIKYKTITYTSDYFPQLMEMAENLIRQSKAYVDDTPREEMHKERMDGVESRCINNSVEENIKLWKEMIAGSDRGLQCCVRGKLDMQDPNKSLRDPAYYRCNPVPHHRIGSNYKIYPTYDFACPYVDSIEDITHALRDNEYHDRNAQYYRIQQHIGLTKVLIYEFSRLNMVYTVLSKRKFLWFVQNGRVDGWDDPRFPTVQGIARRGLKIEALIQFILEQGASKNINLMEWDKLWTINKKIIDPVCPRHTAVVEERRVLLTLTDGPEKPFVRIIPRHKKYEGAGRKATTYTKRIWLDYADAKLISIDEEVTMMDWGNAIFKGIEKDQDGKVTQLAGVSHLQGSVKTTKSLKLTYLATGNRRISSSLISRV